MDNVSSYSNSVRVHRISNSTHTTPRKMEKSSALPGICFAFGWDVTRAALIFELVASVLNTQQTWTQKNQLICVFSTNAEATGDAAAGSMSAQRLFAVGSGLRRSCNPMSHSNFMHAIRRRRLYRINFCRTYLQEFDCTYFYPKSEA